MTLHRFFINPLSITGQKIVLPPDVSRQIKQVLRLKAGDRVVVFDNEKQYLVQLEKVENIIECSIISQIENTSEPKTFITLYQALIPREKFETVLQKGTEIGVSSFVPLETKRSLIKKRDVKAEKINRWQKIIQEAAEQSERGKVPQVQNVFSFEEAVGKAVNEGTVLVAWENEDQCFLSEEILSAAPGGLQDDNVEEEKISIFIGPEGGFEEGEIEFAKKLGAKTVSLGPRILRSETAGILFASIILFSKGGFNKTGESAKY